MDHFLVLIANPAKRPLTGEDIDRARIRIDSGKGSSAGADWLSDGEAAEMAFAAADLDAVKAALADGALDGLDVAIVSAENRRKKLLIADMDSTMITAECIDELADFAGKKDEISAITAAAMRGELDFEDALRERIAKISGLDESELQRCYDERIHPMPGAETLLATMKKNGAYAALVSGGFTYFTSRVAARLGFDTDQANTLLFDNNKLAGVGDPILDSGAKLDALNRYCQELGIGIEDSLAVGDGSNDKPMIVAAGLGVAAHAKPVLKDAADVSIDQGDLTALLYLQGYHRDEFITG